MQIKLSICNSNSGQSPAELISAGDPAEHLRQKRWLLETCFYCLKVIYKEKPICISILGKNPFVIKDGNTRPFSEKRPE